MFLKSLSTEESKIYIQVIFVRVYLSCKLSNYKFTEDDVIYFFNKYLHDCGLSTKRNPLTLKNIISQFDIINSFYEMYEIALNLNDALINVESRYEKGKGSFSPRMKKGQYVWFPNIGLTLVEEIRSAISVNLYRFELEPLTVKSNFIMTLTDELPLHRKNLGNNT